MINLFQLSANSCNCLSSHPLRSTALFNVRGEGEKRNWLNSFISQGRPHSHKRPIRIQTGIVRQHDMVVMTQGKGGAETAIAKIPSLPPRAAMTTWGESRFVRLQQRYRNITGGPSGSVALTVAEDGKTFDLGKVLLCLQYYRYEVRAYKRHSNIKF